MKFIKYNLKNSIYLYIFLIIWMGFGISCYIDKDFQTGNIMSATAAILFTINIIADYRKFKE